MTGGGVSLAELDPRTMESRRHPGLFLCGELLDAFGPIGGYNFLWAWATGRLAGLSAATASRCTMRSYGGMTRPIQSDFCISGFKFLQNLHELLCAAIAGRGLLK